MDNLSLFFVLVSIIVLIYIIQIFRTSKRIPLLFEILFIGVYLCILLIFLFPQILPIIEGILGIDSAINFIIYLSIFVAYFLIFLLYKRSEDRRVEITMLVREIAYLKNSLNKKNKK